MILLIGEASRRRRLVGIRRRARACGGHGPDDEAHAAFESNRRRVALAGVALVDAHLLGSTAAILGDWDLQSTLLRRMLQEGALRIPVGEDGAEAIVGRQRRPIEAFQRTLVAASRGARSDCRAVICAVVEDSRPSN